MSELVEITRRPRIWEAAGDYFVLAAWSQATTTAPALPLYPSGEPIHRAELLVDLSELYLGRTTCLGADGRGSALWRCVRRASP